MNQATINANSAGQVLLLDGSGGVTNTGALEASNGGVLQIRGITVNNAGGNIPANGATVQIFGGAVIQGGTLNTLNQNFRFQFSPDRSCTPECL